MNIKEMRNLAIAIFKTINNLNCSFMIEIFTAKANPRVRPNAITVKRHSTATHENISLTTLLCPKIWNSLPGNKK